MKPADIAEIVTIGSPAVSPDGSWIAYVVTRVDAEANRYRSAIWLAAADGSVPPRQLTRGQRSDTQPVWSPDGSLLAFTSTNGDDDDRNRHTLDVLPMGGPGERVTVVARDEPIESPVWSGDGSQLAFVSRVRHERYSAKDDRDRPPLKVDRLFSRVDSLGWTVDRPAHVFVVPADGSGPARQVTDGHHDHGSPSWSPDGRQLAVVAARHDDADLDIVNDVYLVDVRNPQASPRRLSNGDAAFQSVSWSPEGDRLAALREPVDIGYHHAQVVVLPVDGGPAEVLTAELDRNCAPYPGARPPVWHGDELLFGVEDHGAAHLYRRHPDGRLDRIVGGDRWVLGHDAAAGVLAFVASTATQPTELFSLVDGVEKQLTRHQDAFLAAHPALEPEHFTVEANDGCPLDAWLIRPEGFEEGRSYPVLLNIHGGPHTQYGHRWFDEFQMYAGAGFAVLYANPRGSTGDTEQFARAIISPKSPVDPGTGWGGVDYDDLMTVVDAALERFPFLDAGRMGVMGGSYGGYMTSWIVGHSQRFAAACSERACNNLLSMEWSSDAAGFFRFEVGVSHLDDPEEYLRMSPISYVKDIRTPLLILHSEEDLRCHIEQADCLFVALRLLRREVDYFRFPAESHELTRGGSPAHRRQRAELILDWFGKRLGTPDQATTGAAAKPDPELVEDPVHR